MAKKIVLSEEERVVLLALEPKGNRHRTLDPSQDELRKKVGVPWSLLTEILRRLREEELVDSVYLGSGRRTYRLTERGKAYRRRHLKKQSTPKRECSRCGLKHRGQYDTCDPCRAYNNANKLIYKLAQDWKMEASDVKAGIRRAMEGE